MLIVTRPGLPVQWSPSQQPSPAHRSLQWCTLQLSSLPQVSPQGGTTTSHAACGSCCLPQGQALGPASLQAPQGPEWHTTSQRCRPQSSCLPHTRMHCRGRRGRGVDRAQQAGDFRMSLQLLRCRNRIQYICYSHAVPLCRTPSLPNEPAADNRSASCGPQLPTGSRGRPHHTTHTYLVCAMLAARQLHRLRSTAAADLGHQTTGRAVAVVTLRGTAGGRPEGVQTVGAAPGGLCCLEACRPLADLRTISTLRLPTKCGRMAAPHRRRRRS